MRDEAISEIGMDDDGRIFVIPAAGDFEHVYRAAMEVYWDRPGRSLSHPAPRSLSPLQWYRQIIAAVADEYGIRLAPTPDTRWIDIPAELQAQIEATGQRC